jgi:hypothetical protein
MCEVGEATRGSDYMETNTHTATDKNMVDWASQLFPMRALAEYDEKYQFYVAYCLETGSVTTADDMKTVLVMMKEVLEDEVSRVMKSRNLSNFFSTPAPFEIWEKWEKFAQEHPGKIEHIVLDLKPPKAGANVRQPAARVAVLAAAA